MQISCSRSYCHKNELVSFFYSLRIQTLFQQTTGYFYLLLPLENYTEHLEIASNSSRARNFFFCKLLLASGFTNMDNINQFIKAGIQDVTKSLRVNDPFFQKMQLQLPKFGPLNSTNWFKFMGKEPRTCPTNYSWSLCETSPTNRSSFTFCEQAWGIHLVFVLRVLIEQSLFSLPYQQ